MNGNARWFKVGFVLVALALGGANAWQLSERMPKVIAQQAALEVAHSWQLAYEDCRTVAEIAISRLGKCREQLDECREPH